MSSDTKDSLNYLATFLVRLVVGVIFAAHGAQKLFGAFGGHGLQSTAEGFAQMGFVPGIFWGALVGGTEFFGGLGLVAGLLTRLSALGLAITMAVAVLKVHWANGLIGQGGFEYPLTLLVVNVALLMRGGGPWSLDALRSKKK